LADRRAPARTLTALAIAALLATVFLGAGAGAVDPGEMATDPSVEARARALGKELRCLVCQNQSIDDSDAELARDLRRLVRDRLKAGDSDTEVLDYVVSRYGDFVLLRPPFKPSTYALWLGPAAIAAAGGLALAVYYRRRTRASDGVPLSASEQDRLDRLLGKREP
jgi:cytochrome c-type biogenesis protein CcmH